MRGTRRIAALGAVALAVALAATASGGVGPVPVEGQGNSHGLRYLKGSYESFDSFFFVVNGYCPGGRLPVGGGGFIAGKPENARIAGSSPEGTGWRLKAQALAGGERRLDVHVICMASEYLSYRSVIVPVSAGNVATGAANCSPGTSLLSGGVALDNGNVVLSAPADGADADRRRDDRWRVKVAIGSGLAYMVVTAICLDLGAGDEWALRVKSARARPESGKTLAADCPKRMATSGGGFKLAAPAADGFVHAMRPRDTRIDANKVPDDRWQVTVVNETNDFRRATAYAVCFA